LVVTSLTNSRATSRIGESSTKGAHHELAGEQHLIGGGR
jgi:hypothetical protein